MKILVGGAVILLVAGLAMAGGVDVKVEKDLVSVTPVDPQGQVTIAGLPGCVMGMHPISVMAKNKKTEMTVNGAVRPDGGFALRIPAAPKHQVKLTFVGADGKKKDISVKVPKGMLASAPPSGAEGVVTETVTVPAGQPIEESPHMIQEEESVIKTDTQIITGEKELGSSGMIE